LGRGRYKILPESGCYFVTAATVNWLPLFSRPALAQIVLDSMGYLHNHDRLIFHAYVLLENHLHFIGSSSDFASEVKKFKSFTARGIIDSLQRSGSEFYLKQLEFFKKRHKEDQTYQLWQEGFHPEAIISDPMLKQKIEYIHNNPVKRGFVDGPEQWRYSSARQYNGDEGLVPVVHVL
jgi:putative transposase